MTKTKSLQSVLVSIVFLTPFIAASGGTVESLVGNKVEQAHQTVWERFIGRDGIMYDYTDLDGKVILPTPEECERSMPNALAWWTPIENGGFFNGMYLVAAGKRYARTPSPDNREKVRKLVQGLFKLQDVADTPGFIARGVASDGRSHYVASSDDQNFPFLLGLWEYLNTDIPTPEERKECRDRIIRHMESLERNEWRIIGDKPHFVRGNWLSTDYHSAVFMLMAVRIAHDASGNEKWRKLYEKLLDEKTAAGALRRKNIRSGPENLANWSAWFYSNCQYAVRELRRRETNEERKRLYSESLRNTAVSAKDLIALYKKYDRDSPKLFTPDWHLMMPPYREQENSADANKLATEQHPVWCKACPAIQHEKTTLKPALCAAWIVALSEDEPLIDSVRPEIIEMIRYADYSRLHYATFFYVENLAYTLYESEKASPAE